MLKSKQSKKQNKKTKVNQTYSGSGELALCTKTTEENSVKDNFLEFYDLAKLLNVSIQQVKDECCMFQIKKFMQSLSKVIVRFGKTESNLQKIAYNCNALGIFDITVPPASFYDAYQSAKKCGYEENVNLIIDFPFGESSFNSKVSDIKEGKRDGVNDITVMLPNVLCKAENYKRLKKQVSKIGRLYKERIGVGLSVTDVTDEELKFALKVIKKSKVGFITLVFGACDEQTVFNKLSLVNKQGVKQKIRILGNIESIDAVIELIKNGVSKILTPYADDIGCSLIKRFNINSVKLK